MNYSVCINLYQQVASDERWRLATATTTTILLLTKIFCIDSSWRLGTEHIYTTAPQTMYTPFPLFSNDRKHWDQIIIHFCFVQSQTYLFFTKCTEKYTNI